MRTTDQQCNPKLAYSQVSTYRIIAGVPKCHTFTPAFFCYPDKRQAYILTSIFANRRLFPLHWGGQEFYMTPCPLSVPATPVPHSILLQRIPQPSEMDFHGWQEADMGRKQCGSQECQFQQRGAKQQKPSKTPPLTCSSIFWKATHPRIMPGVRKGQIMAFLGHHCNITGSSTMAGGPLSTATVICSLLPPGKPSH